MKTSKDRPPILRFLLMFAALLAAATCLAALSFAAHPPVETEPAAARPDNHPFHTHRQEKAT